VIKMKKIFFILEFSENECANSSIEEKKKTKKTGFSHVNAILLAF